MLRVSSILSLPTSYLAGFLTILRTQAISSVAIRVSVLVLQRFISRKTADAQVQGEEQMHNEEADKVIHDGHTAEVLQSIHELCANGKSCILDPKLQEAARDYSAAYAQYLRTAVTLVRLLPVGN